MELQAGCAMGLLLCLQPTTMALLCGEDAAGSQHEHLMVGGDSRGESIALGAGWPVHGAAPGAKALGAAMLQGAIAQERSRCEGGRGELEGAIGRMWAVPPAAPCCQLCPLIVSLCGEPHGEGIQCTCRPFPDSCEGSS